MSSMVELVVAIVAFVSACIFLAHAIEAYRGLEVERGTEADASCQTVDTAREVPRMGVHNAHH
jgi:hypothetical protein